MTTAVADPRSHEPQEEVIEEDRARADVYGLLANVFYSPPSENLLRGVAVAGVIDGDARQSQLAMSWSALRRAAQAADAGAVRQEYDKAFITAGRPPVFLYGSFYQAGFLMDKPLAQLRDDLAKLGLARNLDVGEPEDHISALCDVMRFLIICAEDVPPAALSAQREFFMRHIAPWYTRLCAAIENAEQTDFYRNVAAFAKEFFDLEVQSFEIA
jgi:TorA maturation chaperone TorD